MWSKEMDTELRRLVEEGISFSFAAASLNSTFKTSLSRNAAIGRAHRLGLKGDRENAQRNKTPRARVMKPRAPRVVHFPEPDAEQVRLRCVEVVSLEVDIFALTESVCHYPSEDAPFTYCGHPVQTGSPYCVPHHAICHNHTPRLRTPHSTRRGDRMSRFSGVYDFEAA